MDTVEIKGSNIPGLRQLLNSDTFALKSRTLSTWLESTKESLSSSLLSLLPVNNNPLDLAPRPKFGTTYLSSTMRISRDQDGKVFVYTKVSDSTEPTDYSNVMSDLGLVKLLEGINDTFLKYYI
jgi:hypothetical protein